MMEEKTAREKELNPDLDTMRTQLSEKLINEKQKL